MSPSPSAVTIARRTLVTLLISAAGGGVAALFNLPAAWLMGGALAVAIAALAGVKVMLPNWLRDATFTMTGLSMGAAVARDSLALMVQWPVTLAAMVVELILIISLTGFLLRKVFGLDRGTAYLSSFPGHLSFVMSIAAAGIGDSRQIIIIQVIRILILTICVPVAATFLPIGHYEGGPAAPPMDLLTLITVAAACGVVGFIFTKLKIPAGYALGAMATSISAKFAGLFEGTMPPLLLVVIFILIGALIGSRFNGITRDEFKRAAIGGLAGTALTVAICTVVTLAVSPFVDMPFGQIWLGLSPGALEGMGALGIALGFDTAVHRRAPRVAAAAAHIRDPGRGDACARQGPAVALPQSSDQLPGKFGDFRMRLTLILAAALVLAATPALARERCDNESNAGDAPFRIIITYGFELGDVDDPQMDEQIYQMEIKRRHAVDARSVRVAGDGCLEAYVQGPDGSWGVQYYDPDSYERLD